MKQCFKISSEKEISNFFHTIDFWYFFSQVKKFCIFSVNKIIVRETLGMLHNLERAKPQFDSHFSRGNCMKYLSLAKKKKSEIVCQTC